jgi:hypothetical protein
MGRVVGWWARWSAPPTSAAAKSADGQVSAGHVNRVADDLKVGITDVAMAAASMVAAQPTERLEGIQLIRVDPINKLKSRGTIHHGRRRSLLIIK